MDFRLLTGVGRKPAHRAPELNSELSKIWVDEFFAWFDSQPIVNGRSKKAIIGLNQPYVQSKLDRFIISEKFSVFSYLLVITNS